MVFVLKMTKILDFFIGLLVFYEFRYLLQYKAKILFRKEDIKLTHCSFNFPTKLSEILNILVNIMGWVLHTQVNFKQVFLIKISDEWFILLVVINNDLFEFLDLFNDYFPLSLPRFKFLLD